MLSQKYQTEQQELIEKIDRLKTELASEKQTTAGAEKWVALIKQYSMPTELTAEMLNTLIEKIVVHEATKGSDGTRTQEIEIFYRFVHLALRSNRVRQIDLKISLISYPPL